MIQNSNQHQRGAIMVEIIAVIALIGIMGTVLFRQVQQRNEELDNINMASEIRMVKEATTAYIQANRPYLELTVCPSDDDYVEVNDTTSIDQYMPTNWACDEDSDNCLINEYRIWLACDRMGDEDRYMIWGLIVPKADFLPRNFSLRRAARVANLIGADGGVHESDNDTLYGTKGTWEIGCGGPCDDQSEDSFHVATTGMDVYIPEVETRAANAVAIPNTLALEELHSTNYFSVGQGLNCIGNYDGGFAHENLVDNVAVRDQILRVGNDTTGELCNPLFWVGTTGSAGTDHSDAGHVYIKNNLYVGRNNANQTQAIAIETGDDNVSRQITVYDTDGKGTVTLNADGQIIGRVNAAGQGYHLDAKTGEIMLFKEYDHTADGVTGKVHVPTMRLTADGQMISARYARYVDDLGVTQTEQYAVDPAETSLMHDIRLTSRGGAKLSDILPNYITKEIKSITQNNSMALTVEKPTCPNGYVRAITVTPVSYTQGVSGGRLEVPIPAGSAGGTVTDENPIDREGALRLTNKGPVSIGIADSGNDWTVSLKYGAENPGISDPISALAQTYCVYDEDHFTDTTLTDYGKPGVGFEAKTAGIQARLTCTTDTDCGSFGYCKDNSCLGYGTCTEADGTALGGNLYCYDGVRVYVECMANTQCPSGQTCTDNRCEDASATP